MVHTMRTKGLIWIGIALAAVGLGSAAIAQDFATHKGSTGRVGRNAAPGTYHPGRTLLDWWRPNGGDLTATSVDVDNLDITKVTRLGFWDWPTSPGQWAEAPYIPERYANVAPAVNPPYYYSFSVPSLSSSQPELPDPVGAGRASTFEWRFSAADLGGTARNYALYIYLPIGPTVLPSTTQVFPQRYYVYEIFYGNGERDVEVVDAFQGGFGFIRLGAGGRQTSRLYEYDGSTTIRIVLHNHVIKRDDGSLAEQIIPGLTPVVYADAALAIPEYGSYRASPIVGDANPLGTRDLRTVAAVNKLELDPNSEQTIERGVVSSYRHNGLPAPNNTVWSYTPSDEGELPVYQDNNSANVFPGAGWTASNTPAGFRGTNYHSAVITDQPLLSTDIRYEPNLSDGSYEIWAWVPGSGGGLTLGTSVRYEILEGVAVTQVNVNQDAASGWVRIGTRRYNHNFTSGDTLKVRVTNLGSAADVGRTSYADTLRFVGTNDVSVSSTPTMALARVNVPALGGLVDRPVVIAAAENGRIYCLDAIGNANGTTNVYWTYPSTADPDNTGWTDPNAVAGEDGGIAEMPTGFRTSSALIERVGGEDLLYITSTNGRVYCIEMAGRGDMDLTLRKPGTTRRRWSFPNDYPATTQSSTLGPSYGSVAFANSGGGPKIIVPASEGRVYALDAAGNANKTTDVDWAFPPENQPTLGACEMTPAVENGDVFVGFRRDSSNVGRFYSLDAANGTINWQFNSFAGWSSPTAGDFVGSPCVIPASELGGGQPDTVVVPNDNLYITALDANTGNVLWSTNELQAPVLGALTYTPQTVYNSAGGLQTFPCVLVPTTDGRFASLFAETTVTNVFAGSNRLAWFYDTLSGQPMETSMAVGRNYMYGADTNGFLYAFDNTLGDAYGGIYTPPGQQGVSPNDPNSAPYRRAKLRFVTRELYERLRLPESDPAFPEYVEAVDPAYNINRNAFEWGETIYAMVYDFPAHYNNDVSLRRTQVDYRFASEGFAIRNLQVSARKFAIIGPNNPPTETVSGQRLDGVAVLSFAIQGNGSNALPPGPGTVGFNLSAQFGPGQGLQSVAVDPSASNRPFSVANPLGVAVQFDNSGIPLANYHIAYVTDPANAEALTNGSPDVGSTTKVESLLISSVGNKPHGAQGNAVFAVYDRSLMTLLRGPNSGLDTVRAIRSDLAWQGGTTSIFKPIDPIAYPGFEDLPNRFPNTSLDYPNIRRESFNIIKERFGEAENPVIQNISLKPPLITNVANPIARILNATRMDFDLDIPRFQPANSTRSVDSAGAAVDGGYLGNLIIYIDGTGNGQFDRRGRTEAYRSIRLGGSVQPDEKITVGKTELDLGSLPQGTGFTPLTPWNLATGYTPWGGPYANLFKSFQVYNEGNTNLLRVRVAKATDTGAALSSWGLYAPENSNASWIDSMFNLWSDIDARFALNNLAGNNRVLIQKARVGDRNPPELLTNPMRRFNANLNVIQSTLLPFPRPEAPKLSVTVPIGTPIGTYLTDIYVIEDDSLNESLTFSGSSPIEAFSQPTMRLRFNVRESRLTNGFTQNTAPMMHGVLTGNEPFLHRHAQPAAMRDLAGQLVVAFASTHNAWNDLQPTAASTNDAWRIFIGSLNGNVPSSVSFGQNPMKDLMDFQNGGSRWFQQAAGPLPTTPVNDPTIFGPNVVTPTARFGAPAFAQLGGINPFVGSRGNPLLVYVGEAQIQNAAGRESASKIFLNELQVGTDGSVTVTGAAASTNDNLEMVKSKPTLVQAGNRATVLYTGTVGGTSRFYSTHFNGATFNSSQPLNVGMGFENVGSASIHGRIYEGAPIPAYGIGTGDEMIDLLFTGKLKGRTNREAFFGRLRSNGSAQFVNVPGTRSPVIPFSQISDEVLSTEPTPGLYRSLGVAWVLNGNVSISQRVGATLTPLVVPTSKSVDNETGIITYDGYAGGKVYVDTTQGTIRFAGSAPNRRAQVLLTYTPRFMRVGAVGNANYQMPSLIYDSRFLSEVDYCADASGNGVNPNATIRANRYTFIYGRSAAGTGETSRPYMKTLRFGIQLLHPQTGRPIALHTLPNGNVSGLSITGQTSFYQVDPAKGRIYFTAADEGRVITLQSFVGLDEATGQPVTFNGLNVPFTVGLLTEQSEGPVSIEGAINESQMASFIDPFDNADPAQRRGGLIWMFWTSTRGGSSDIYMQTIAPKLTPRPRSQGN